MDKNEFLELAGKEYDKLNKLNELDNFYDYEKDFDRIWKNLGQKVLQLNLGEQSNDVRKKNAINHLW